MSKSICYCYDGFAINIYNVEINKEKLIQIREKIMKNCCQYNHAIYETKGYPNLMDESKNYLSIIDTGKYEINHKYGDWDTDEEEDSKIKVYLVDVIEYIKPSIIKDIDNILYGNYDNIIEISQIASTNSNYFDFEKQKLQNLKQQCDILNKINGQNNVELISVLNQLRKDIDIILENIANNQNVISVSVYAAEIKDAINYELIDSASVEEFNKANIYTLIKKKENKQ